MPLREPAVVLVVEDHLDTRELYVQSLQAAGFRCVMAEFADEALKQLQEVRVDAVVMDLGLPRLEGGLALAWRLRGRAESVPIIAVTGHPRERLPDKLFSGYLMKPIDLDALVRTVAELTP